MLLTSTLFEEIKYLTELKTDTIECKVVLGIEKTEQFNGQTVKTNST